MKILIHKNAESPVKVISSHNEEVQLTGSTCTAAFWELAEKFPGEVIGWCEEEFQNHFSIENWQEVFHHDLIMASYAVKSTFLSPAVGYIDQMPFITVNREVLYGTWQMSSDIGGVKGEVLIRFKDIFGSILDFGYLLNSVAKTGQQNGLFCYSAPGLLTISGKKELIYTAGNSELFNFVSQHYKVFRSVVLLWCLLRYERKVSLGAFVLSLFRKRYSNHTLDLSGIKVFSTKKEGISASVDVIIPTMGRPNHLLQVIKDLSAQTLVPEKVIIVEQNPEKDSVSNLSELHETTWPFKVVHHFIHQTGACNARNKALKETTADWVFFCDDDNRFEPALLQTAIEEISDYGIDMINTAYLQQKEKPLYKKVKQWGTFGSGNAIVRSNYLQDLKFDMAFEHGFGEDKDFGMQLRNKGVDIIYHPKVEIVHLKAPMGGFREVPTFPWAKDDLEPKPSPTVMVYAKKNYSLEQQRGYKVVLFLKFYNKQKIRNPFLYVREMRKRWKNSEAWAEFLIDKTTENPVYHK